MLKYEPALQVGGVHEFEPDEPLPQVWLVGQEVHDEAPASE